MGLSAGRGVRQNVRADRAVPARARPRTVRTNRGRTVWLRSRRSRSRKRPTGETSRTPAAGASRARPGRPRPSRNERAHWRDRSSRRIDAARVRHDPRVLRRTCCGGTPRSAGLDPAFADRSTAPEADELKVRRRRGGVQGRPRQRAGRGGARRRTPGSRPPGPWSPRTGCGRRRGAWCGAWLDGDPALLSRAGGTPAHWRTSRGPTAWTADEHVPRLAGDAGNRRTRPSGELAGAADPNTPTVPRSTPGGSKSRRELAGILTDCRADRSPPSAVAGRALELRRSANMNKLGRQGDQWPDDDGHQTGATPLRAS